jgi:hypothetical protein
MFEGTKKTWLIAKHRTIIQQETEKIRRKAIFLNGGPMTRGMGNWGGEEINVAKAVEAIVRIRHPTATFYFNLYTASYTAAVEQELLKLVHPAVIADVQAYIAASADLRRATEKYAAITPDQLDPKGR